ncbi:response regulator [Ramlibacter alkalitolerans]|uniref:Response regulator n=1 Tax=Ramlibacter alkalitolerans TaxID=2039631 RepID=A0ABS1JJ78_9BURK|nr:response regulator [Ramlibacter alkalitolerans]MBL0424285.1 response regulator [Ramlibacter alkalitolerans]
MPLRALPDPEKAKPCVLVIDDDEAVAWAIASRLGRDFRVVGLTEPQQAVARACEENPGVILCDIHMPGMQGDEVAFALSQEPRTARIPLVYLTALVAPDEVPDLEGVFGEYPTVSKMASPEDLREIVTMILGIAPDAAN